MDFNTVKKLILFLTIFANSSVSNALVIHDYDLLVDDTYFLGPDSYILNGGTNPNDVFYKRLAITPFTLEEGETYQFNFNFSQTVWLYDLGLPYGGDSEVIGPSFLLDYTSRLNNTPTTRDLDLRLSSIDVNIDAIDASMNQNNFSFFREPPGRAETNGFSGSGFSPVSFVDVTDNVLGINSIQLDFYVNSVDFNGGSSYFDYIDLRIMGDNVSTTAPVTVNEPTTFVPLLICLALLIQFRRHRSVITTN